MENVFISFDPERDTPVKVREYLDYFDPRFIDLAGNRPALEDAPESFKTFLGEYQDDFSDDHQITLSSAPTSLPPLLGL